MEKNEIRHRISTGLPGARVAVEGDDGAHFRAEIVCASFAGQGTLVRHKRVYATLGDAVGREIHALSLSTLTPDEAAAVGSDD